MKTRRWLVSSMAWALILTACGKLTDSLPDVDPNSDPDAAPIERPDVPTQDASSIPTDARPVVIEDYDQSCQVNGDCALALRAPCPDGRCWCVDAPIAVTDSRRYAEALFAEARASGCKTLPAARCPDQCADNLVALCEAGRCTASPPPPPVDLSEYERACESDEDCVGVTASSCYCDPCPDAVVARTELARFEAERAALPPCGTRGTCDDTLVCSFTTIRCAAGRCELRRTAGPP